jgi:hypothetical protein
MQRRVEPEILDQLPAGDPAATRSRRELRLINALMGNHRWLARQVRRFREPAWRVLELGAGDGALGCRLAAGGDGGWLCGIDLAPRPEAWPASGDWRQADVLAMPLPVAEIVVANLFLHHFAAPQLAHLGANLPGECRVLICSEPARRRVHLVQAALLAAVARFGHVTRHDMPVSIRAGFIGAELARSLRIGDWRIAVSTSWLGAYRLVAQRL